MEMYTRTYNVTEEITIVIEVLETGMESIVKGQRIIRERYQRVAKADVLSFHWNRTLDGYVHFVDHPFDSQISDQLVTLLSRYLKVEDKRRMEDTVDMNAYNLQYQKAIRKLTLPAPEPTFKPLTDREYDAWISQYKAM